MRQASTFYPSSAFQSNGVLFAPASSTGKQRFVLGATGRRAASTEDWPSHVYLGQSRTHTYAVFASLILLAAAVRVHRRSNDYHRCARHAHQRHTLVVGKAFEKRYSVACVRPSPIIQAVMGELPILRNLTASFTMANAQRMTTRQRVWACRMTVSTVFDKQVEQGWLKLLFFRHP